MLTTAVVLFLLAAVGGLVMAMAIFKGRTPPVLLAAGHGVLAATALGLVLWAVVAGGAPTAAGIAAAILVVAALGGFYLLGFHLRGQPHPRPVVVIHALAAVAGVGALLFAVL